MTTNQATIDRYVDEFRRGDHAVFEMREGRIRKLISYLVFLS